MKYRFEHIENGQVGDGLAVLTIQNGECDARTPAEQDLAKRNGGKPKTRRRVKAQEGK